MDMNAKANVIPVRCNKCGRTSFKDNGKEAEWVCPWKCGA